MPKKQPDPQAEQSRRFIEAAREIGTDEDPESFKRRLKALVSAPPPESVQSRKIVHDSDCATHNGPAYEAGPCDCSLSKSER